MYEFSEIKTIPAGECFQLTETASFAALTIGDGASVAAPDGMLVTLTAGGVEIPVAPGTYESAVLTVTENYTGIVDEFYDDGYRTALFISGGEIDPRRSVTAALSGGSWDAASMKGVSVKSENEVFSGVIAMDGEYAISDSEFTFSGPGSNDFAGKGACIVASGTSKVTVDNVKISNRGVIRGCALSADNATLIMKNAEIIALGGTDEEAEVRAQAVGGMTCVPWMLGLSGNNRATNVVGSGTAIYENCTIRAERWGVLSTDGVDSPKRFGEYRVNLTARDCLIEITGESGYGSYSIGACRNIFDHTTFNVPDYALIIANEYAGGDFVNGSVVNSDRFGVMWHQNQRGVLNVEDSAFNTGQSCFLIKGCYPDIRVARSKLSAKNGVILQMIDSDDPGMGNPEFRENGEPAEKVGGHDVTAENFANCSIFGMERAQYPTDARAVFRDMSIEGDFYNAINRPARVGMVLPEGMNPFAASHGDDGPGGPPAGGPGGPGEPGGHGHPPPMAASTELPVNLSLGFENCAVKGVISASIARHNVDVINPGNRIELGQVTNTASPVVNNGVLLSLDKSSKWTVTGLCYLSRLDIAEGAVIEGVDGRPAKLTVDGAETAISSGSYKGDIIVRI